MGTHLFGEGGRGRWSERACERITGETARGMALARRRPNAEIGRDDHVFHALLVAFWRFGIIYSYVLRALPAFRLAEWTTRIPAVALSAALRAGVASGTFLAPLLAMLPPPPASLNAVNIPSPRIVE